MTAIHPRLTNPQRRALRALSKESIPTNEQNIAKLEKRVDELTDLMERFVYELALIKGGKST